VGEVFPSITKFRARLRLTMHKVVWRGATGQPSVGIRIWNVWGWCDVDPASGGYCTGARGGRGVLSGGDCEMQATEFGESRRVYLEIRSRCDSAMAGKYAW
jgi:hypothetical protein